MQTQVSTKYQVVIPKEVRKKIDIKPGQKLNIYTAGDQIILSSKMNWPGDHLKQLRGLWKNINVSTFLEEERKSWE